MTDEQMEYIWKESILPLISKLHFFSYVVSILLILHNNMLAINDFKVKVKENMFPVFCYKESRCTKRMETDMKILH